MKELRKITLLVIALIACMSQIAFAASSTTIVVNGETSSKSIYQNNGRGEFLAEGSVEIINNQDGTIDVVIATVAYRNVNRIFHTAHLDMWDEDSEDWVRQDTWSFEATEEDKPNGLSLLTNTLTLSGYETNKYYRVRGLHGVELGDEIEACATETDGILITDGPT